MTWKGQRPSVVVFELPTARSIGAQLRHGRGRHLDEVRTAARKLLHGGDR
jgi:hypothetical protein